MTDEGRTRRTFQLANFCIANISAYRVNWKTVAQKKELRVDNDFWKRANGTFFDMSVIEWCKLFADSKGKHHWTKTFNDRSKWKQDLLQHMSMKEEDFDCELLKIKSYRDRYVAHLDEPKSMNYPLTEVMLKSTFFLYDSLKNCASTKIHLGPIYDSAEQYYLRLMNEYNQEIELRLKLPM